MTVLVNDVTISNMPVKFMFSLSNGTRKFTTKLTNIKPMFVSGGQTLVLQCSDLAEYFAENNLNFNGYNYRNIGQLPAGNNRLQIYMIDQTTGKKISNVAVLNMLDTLAEPPVLRYPKNNETFETTSQYPTINFE